LIGMVSHHGQKTLDIPGEGLLEVDRQVDVRQAQCLKGPLGGPVQRVGRDVIGPCHTLTVGRVGAGGEGSVGQRLGLGHDRKR